MVSSILYPAIAVLMLGCGIILPTGILSMRTKARNKAHEIEIVVSLLILSLIGAAFLVLGVVGILMPNEIIPLIRLFG